jgi:uncharacterized protein YkwD
VGFCIAVLALCGLPSVAAAAEGPEERMIEEINKLRSREGGLPPLRSSSNLERSAGSFSRWLLRHDLLTHRPAVSVTRSYSHSGEALAMHYSRQARVKPTLRTWLSSTAHRGLVLTGSMNLVGIGHASGRRHGRPRTVWVIQVARR